MIIKNIRNIFVVPALIISTLASVLNASGWQSKMVYYDSKGKLVYPRDNEGNRIPDFSYAGYKGGTVALPEVKVVKTISPVAGDNTKNIQDAINEVGTYPLDANGIRGALLLNPGIYPVYGTINLNYDGVILRGSGDDSDPLSNTILLGKGDTPHQRTILVAGGGSNSSKWNDSVKNTKTNIITDSVYVGDNSFQVENAAPYSVGDNIIITHPCTDAWLKAVDYGGTADAAPWNPTGFSLTIVFNRYITKIERNTITIDAPVFNHLIRSLSQSYIYKYTRKGIKTNIGIEKLRIDIEASSETDENHAWQAIDLYQIEDSWVQDCTMLHFGQSAVRTSVATRITVLNCKALDPKSSIEGERRYNFNVYTASQQILFNKCQATNGRHHYVSNGTTYTSGCVFLDCTSKGAYTSSEGHRQWSMGLLYDNIVHLDGPRSGGDDRFLGLYNRGNYGTSHGWAAAHSVAWRYNSNTGHILIQKPPTAQNYAIGCFGKEVTGKKPPAPFLQPEGYIEGTGKDSLNPRSLYLAQLQERMQGTVNVETTGYNVKPEEFRILQNYPNPFNPNTVIRYSLPLDSNVTLRIFDAAGKEVKTLVNAYQKAGINTASWDGRDNNGKETGSGIYLYKVVTSYGMLAGKMLMVK